MNREDEEYCRTFEEQLDKQARERTPEERRRLFQDLGILDEHGNVAEGRVALVQHLIDFASKMEKEAKKE
jgi:hypothetical protein